MSLDGMVDAPTWTFDYEFLPEMEAAIGAVTGRCRGILLGRTTYEMFEPAWSTRTVEDDPGAPFFNDTTKYVVSGTLKNATWRNSKIIGPYDPVAIRRLKDECDADIYTSGSGTLGLGETSSADRPLASHGLITRSHPAGARPVAVSYAVGAGRALFTRSSQGGCRVATCPRYLPSRSSSGPCKRKTNGKRSNGHDRTAGQGPGEGRDRRAGPRPHRRCVRRGGGAKRRGGEGRGNALPPGSRFWVRP